VHLRSGDRLHNHLVHRAGKCGPVRRKMEHGRRDYERPLRKNPDWYGNKPRPNLFHWWIFRLSPDSIGRACFRLGPSPDDCSGWPADRSWDRAVQSVSGQRDLGRYRALRSLLGRLERHSLLKHKFFDPFLTRRLASRPNEGGRCHFPDVGRNARKEPLWVISHSCH
jgi:hypothetical protein